jgi:hypothetical protein
VATYTDPGFGFYLRSDSRILADYREWTGKALADMPRLVVLWREQSDAMDRDSFSLAQAEKWLRDHAGSDGQDLADCQIYAKIWVAR